jgi:hypothetical protein
VARDATSAVEASKGLPPPRVPLSTMFGGVVCCAPRVSGGGGSNGPGRPVGEGIAAKGAVDVGASPVEVAPALSVSSSSDLPQSAACKRPEIAAVKTSVPAVPVSLHIARRVCWVLAIPASHGREQLALPTKSAGPQPRIGCLYAKTHAIGKFLDEFNGWISASDTATVACGATRSHRMTCLSRAPSVVRLLRCRRLIAMCCSPSCCGDGEKMNCRKTRSLYIFYSKGNAERMGNSDSPSGSPTRPSLVRNTIRNIVELHDST